MPDRIDKSALDQINPYDSYRVERARETKDDDQSKGQNPQDQESEKDGFDQGVGENLYQNLTGKSAQQKSTVSLALEDIEKAWFDGIDLKTDPSHLMLKVKTYRDERVFLLKTPVSRAQALSLKSNPVDQVINLKKIFSDQKIWVEVMKVSASPDEEVTKVSGKTQDYTLSQTVKMSEKRSLWQRLRIVDENQQLNLEVALAAITATAVLIFLVIGGLYLAL